MTNGEVIYFTDCSMAKNLPSIWFMMDGNWYQMDPSDYVVNAGATCQLCISSTTRAQFVFGVVF